MGDSLVHWKYKFCYALNLTTSTAQLLACASCFCHAPSCHSMKCPVLANCILGRYPINKDTHHLHSWLPWIIMYNSHDLFKTRSLLSQSWQWQGLVYKCLSSLTWWKQRRQRKQRNWAIKFATKPLTKNDFWGTLSTIDDCGKPPFLISILQLATGCPIWDHGLDAFIILLPRCMVRAAPPIFSMYFSHPRVYSYTDSEEE